jgi:hypothetical protein
VQNPSTIESMGWSSQQFTALLFCLKTQCMLCASALPPLDAVPYQKKAPTQLI